MAMFLESCLNVNDSEAFSYKRVTYIKKYSRKLISLCSKKIGPKKVPTKINVLEQYGGNMCKLRTN